LAFRRATDRLEAEMMAEFIDKMRRPQVKPTTFDLSELLSTMILLLPAPQQEVVQLTFFKGLSQRDIAAQKSISLGTMVSENSNFCRATNYAGTPGKIVSRPAGYCHRKSLFLPGIRIAGAFSNAL